VISFKICHVRTLFPADVPGIRTAGSKFTSLQMDKYDKINKKIKKKQKNY
jgi:hypothetical protein